MSNCSYTLSLHAVSAINGQTSREYSEIIVSAANSCISVCDLSASPGQPWNECGKKKKVVYRI